MKTKILYIVSLIAIAIPWLFLMEAFPISYSQISTAAEVTAEGLMFLALLAVVVFLRKELKRLKAGGAEKGKVDHGRNAGAGRSNRTDRLIGRILFMLAALTLFLVGLVLVLIAISFSL